MLQKFNTDRGEGCLYGAFIGDALGGRYEFSKNVDLLVNNDLINGFLPILGGGHWNLTKGQVTDDSELTCACAIALINNLSFINQSILVKEYHAWFKSKPFDIGNTTFNSFQHNNINDMVIAANKYNSRTLKYFNTNNISNGCLMRISPIGIWFAKELYENGSLNFGSIRNSVKLDTELTNPNIESIDMATSFILLIAYAIVYGKVHTGIQYLINCDELCLDIKNIIINATNPNMCSELIHDAKVNMGDARIAFQLAVKYSYFDYTFHDALVETIKLGGDCDTNANIVGALVGAKVGSENIPKIWIQTIVDTSKDEKVERYNKYQLCRNILSQVPNVVEAIYNH